MTNKLKYFLLLIVTISIGTSSIAQSLTLQSDIAVSPDNFISGIYRKGNQDVQLSTGKIVQVYGDQDAVGATTKDIWCIIYNSDMTILVNAFKVNTTTTNDQEYPTVKINQADNSFYVSWMGKQLNGVDYEVYAKKISLDVNNTTSSTISTTTYPDIQINSITPGHQYSAIMVLSGSEILFVFRDDGGGDGSGIGVFGVRRTAFDLTLIQSQFVLSTVTTSNQVLFSADIDNNGILYIVYSSNDVAANAYDVYVNRLTLGTSTYNSIGAFRVNNYVAGDQNNANIVIDPVTNFYVISWSSAQDGSGWGVYSKIYYGTILVKDEFQVNNTTTDNQLLSRVVWEPSTKQIIYFFHNSNASTSTLKYRIFDGSLGVYNAVTTDLDLISGTNTANAYGQSYITIYNSYTNKLIVNYDIYNNFSNDSKTRMRSFLFTYPGLFPAPFLNVTDLNRNWIHTRSYAEDGTLVAESRAYYDSLGTPTQSQTRNVVEGKILASMPVYDVYHRPVVQTLAAPITEQLFTYKTNFITSQNNPTIAYNYNDFDKAITTSNLQGEINNPKKVDSTNSLLGMYYSDNNTYDQSVAATKFPYSRIYYNDNVYGGVVSGSSPGDGLRMGKGHERKAIALPILNELDHYIQQKKSFFGASTIPASTTTMAFRGIKTVTVDENGIENITFSDLEGHTIASAKALGTATAMQANLSYSTSSAELDAISWDQIYNVKILSSSDDIEVRYLQDNSLIFSGSASDFNLLSTTYSNSFQIRSNSPFTYSYTSIDHSNNVITNSSSLASTDVTSGNGVVDIYIKDPSSLTLSLASSMYQPTGSAITIKVIDLTSGTIIYTGAYSSFSNTLIPGTGFYRIQLESVPVTYDYTPANFYLKVSFNFPYSDLSYYFYDLKGNMVGKVAPNGVITSSSASPNYKSTFTYSSLGKVLTSTEVEGGLTQYVYRKDGSLRFTQNAKQRISNKFAYTNYDYFGRTIESGEYDPSLVTSNAKVFIDQVTQENATTPDPNSVYTVLENVVIGGGLESIARTQVNYVSYDAIATDATRTQVYTRGKASATYKKNADTDAAYICKTWYSYDERGRLVWMDQTLTGLGTKTTDYTYTRELLTNVVYQNATTAERFEHKYSYDAMQRMKKTESAIGLGTYQTEAQYYYYLHGPLKRKELGNNVQGLDYVYTAQGWLKSINHPELNSTKDPGHDGATGSAFSKDVFGMSFDYYSGDYRRTGANVNNTINSSLATQNFNGIITAINWQTVGQGISGNPAQYNYTYDYKYQLIGANFGSYNITTKNFVADASGKYSGSASYDANGNLLTMNTNKGAVTGDNYLYSYFVWVNTPSTNKLTSVSNGANSNDTRYYQYDEIGQMTNQTNGAGLQKQVTYNVYGKVTDVKDAGGNLKVSFTYNERNQRIKKTTYTTGGVVSYMTWYITDLAGNELSIYDNKSGTLGQTEIPIFGSERIGVVHRSGSSTVYSYEIKDHLGNVRATVDRVKQTNGDATLITWMDYLPFGEVNPERHSFSSYERRYECQGEYADYDTETEWDAFDLRMYDARIGRWLSCDPKRQHWSPYLGMANNPINYNDPSGGEDEGGNAHGQQEGYDIVTEGGGYNKGYDESVARAASLMNNIEYFSGGVVESITEMFKNNSFDPEEINRRFGTSFMKDYYSVVKKGIDVNAIGVSTEGLETLENFLKSTSNIYIQDADNEFSLRPVNYTIYFGKEELRSETNKYGLIPSKVTSGNIIESQFMTNDPIFENPGRLNLDGSSKPFGWGNSDGDFYYIKIGFQKAPAN